MPWVCASDRMIGVDSSKSSALPAGTPSRISVITTSARPRSTIRCAVVEPTNPPPTTVTFLRIRELLRKCDEVRIVVPSEQRERGISPSLVAQISAGEVISIRGDARLHVFDNGRREFRGAQFFGAFHQTFEVVGNAFLADGVLDSIFDQPGRFLPSHEVKHHGA